MRPPPAGDNLIDRPAANAIFGGQTAYSLPGLGRWYSPNGANVRFGKLGCAVSLAKILAPLPAHVRRVVCLGAKEQMRRITARAVIARVTDNKPLGNRSEDKFKNRAMRGYPYLAFWSTINQPPVPARHNACGPGPALVGRSLFDLRPKTRFNRRAGILAGHRKLLFRWAGGRVNAATGNSTATNYSTAAWGTRT